MQSGMNQFPVPYFAAVRNGIPRGGEVELNGEIITGNEQAIWFEYRSDDGIPVHIAIRFGLQNEHVTVFNAYDKQRWGHEERHKVNVNPGSPINVIVTNHLSNWEITVNGKKNTFPHRHSAGNITRLEIRGDLRINSLQFRNLQGHIDQTPNFGGQTYQPQFRPNPYEPTGFTDHSLGIGQGIVGASASVNTLGGNSGISSGMVGAGHGVGGGGGAGSHGYDNRGVGAGYTGAGNIGAGSGFGQQQQHGVGYQSGGIGGVGASHGLPSHGAGVGVGTGFSTTTTSYGIGGVGGMGASHGQQVLHPSGVVGASSGCEQRSGYQSNTGPVPSGNIGPGGVHECNQPHPSGGGYY